MIHEKSMEGSHIIENVNGGYELSFEEKDENE